MHAPSFLAPSSTEKNKQMVMGKYTMFPYKNSTEMQILRNEIWINKHMSCKTVENTLATIGNMLYITVCKQKKLITVTWDKILLAT